jgi:hypothetical protein
MVERLEHDLMQNILTKPPYQSCRQFVVNGSLLDPDTRQLLMACRQPVVLSKVFHKARSMTPRVLLEVRVALIQC